MAQPRQAILLGHACHTPAWPVPSTLSASIQMTYLQTVREVSHGLSWVYSCSATRTPRGILLSEALRSTLVTTLDQAKLSGCLLWDPLCLGVSSSLYPGVHTLYPIRTTLLRHTWPAVSQLPQYSHSVFLPDRTLAIL